VQRRIFRPKREEVAGGWRRLRNEELHNLYTSPNIVKLFKSRRMRWVGHVTRMVKIRNMYKILVGISEEINHIRNFSVDAKIILKWKQGGKLWTRCIWTSGGLL
jgi:hypothetical protein